MKFKASWSWLFLILLSSLFGSEAALGQGQNLQLTNTSGGTAGWVRVTDDNSLEPQTLSIEAWITPRGSGYQTGSNVGGMVVSKPIEGASGPFIQSYGLSWVPSTGLIRAIITDDLRNTGQLLYSNRPVQVGHTNHIAMTFDGTWLRLYINGHLDAEVESAATTIDYGDEDVLLGAANFVSGAKRRFQGEIDEVRLWDHARTRDQIGNLKNCELVGNEAGLLAYYNFNAGDATDDSDNGHDGVSEGVFAYSTQEDRCPDLTDGFETGDLAAWSGSVQ